MRKKYLLGLFLSSVFVFSSCGNVAEDNADTVDNIEVVEEDENTNDEVEIIKENLAYSGKMVDYNSDKPDISIHMTLTIYSDGGVVGSYYYDKYNKDIQLVGQLNGDEISLKTKDNSEEFIGNVSGGEIFGDWKSGDKTLYFYVNPVEETYGKEIMQEIVVDEYIYYFVDRVDDKGIYRCNLDGSNNIRLADANTDGSIDVYKDKVYYINTDYKLSRMNIDGSNQEEIFSDIILEFGFILYEDRIYFDNYAGEYGNEDFVPKLVSVDLDGKDYEEQWMTAFIMEDEDRLKDYYLSYIYRDYAFFSSLEEGDEADIYRIEIDGYIDPYIDGGYAVGCANEDFYYMGVDSSVLYKVGIWNYDYEPKKVFEGVDSYKNTDLENEITIMTDKYIVYSYTMQYDETHFITVMDLDGKILNEIKVDKVTKDGENQREELAATLVDDYLYFNVNNDVNGKGYVAKVNVLDDDIEMLTELK